VGDSVDYGYEIGRKMIRDGLLERNKKVSKGNVTERRRNLKGEPPVDNLRGEPET